ncbi:isoaspartyl peptidase/L-asparaginase family protein [Microbacterium sediminis]|uniref:isoaspartyl peptidase/L-asparaginase family protein n=1 Tax=Microbacterium sediminis TaxID=904291 RepID=UPI000A97C26E|nr:isoaspartyl peptidase/L-asparaginase [Microbacterium sediminis]
MSRELRLTSHRTRTERPYALVLHAGAGGRVEELSLEDQANYGAGLRRAYEAGERVLESGGTAEEAVCATVAVLEDTPLFNAGRGAALTASGRAELDASGMTGDGRAGAVAGTTRIKNPVYAAQQVMSESDHVLLVAPPEELAVSWGLELVEPEYFVTEARLKQLENVQARQLEASRHGTVGAVALDRAGRIAAATSTGGMVNQADGRVGDTPIIGAGTYARDGIGGVSCTGEGEAFIRGVVAHDIVSRMRYLGQSLEGAVSATFDHELTSRDASGGIIAIDHERNVIIAHNSPAMFAAYRDGNDIVTLT